MSYIKYWGFVFMCIISISCNSQKNNNAGITIYKEKFRTLYKEVKKNQEAPIYIYEFDYSNVYIEMYINNKLFLKSYSYVDGIQDYNLINQYISSKETQNLRIVVKPIEDELFDDQSFFKVRLSSFDKKSHYDSDSWSNELKKIVEYTSNEFTRDSTGMLIGGYVKGKRLEGKPYFEKEFEFNGKLPFKLPNLQETSKDLRELDEVVLKNQLAAYFNRFIKSVNNSNDEAFYWETVYKKAYLDCIANYRTEDEIQTNYYKNTEFLFSDKRAMFLPIKDYKMVFYDNGRLVTLESTSSDNKKKGKSVLNLEFKQEGKKTQESNKMNFYFHIPKDSTNLEVVF